MTLKIGSHEIDTGRVFVIAEIGNNHNGSFERAIQMVDIAVNMGADCVKFQMRHLEEVYRKRSLLKDGEDLGTEYALDLLRRFELSVEEQQKLSEYCAQKKILYLKQELKGIRDDEYVMGVLQELEMEVGVL